MHVKVRVMSFMSTGVICSSRLISKDVVFEQAMRHGKKRQVLHNDSKCFTCCSLSEDEDARCTEGLKGSHG